MRKSKKSSKFDYILFFTILGLIVFGILFLSSVSSHFSLQISEKTTYFLSHQVKYGLIPGLILALFLFFIPLKFLKKISPILFILNLIFLGLVFVPGIGANWGGASRWIEIGGFSLQPSEFLKLTLILYFGAWIKSRYDARKRRKSYSLRQKIIQDFKQLLLPFFAVMTVISLIFIFQPDISTLGIIATTAVILYFSASTPIWHILLIGISGLGGLILLIIKSPYRFSRLLLLLRPEVDPLGKGFQIKQILIAIGSGGILGQGIGQSSQKLGFLPLPMSDTIFAVFAEELGFIGVFFLIILFLFFFWRVVKISKSTNDIFLKLTSIGIGSWITIQAFINIGALIGVLPLTGIPLPFFSYGGSHLTVELAAMGLLLNISKSC